MKAKFPIVSAAALLACVLAPDPAAAQVANSPVGPTWDCVLSGKGQRGIAFISFFEDYTFRGYQVLSGEKIATEDPEGRNATGDLGRQDNLLGHDSAKTNVFVYGFDRFTGRWAYDAQGRVIGNFMTVVDSNESQIDMVTNSVSFTAKVQPGKRLTLLAQNSTGGINYRGVPYARQLPSMSGNWYGNSKIKKQVHTDFYTLVSIVDENPWQEDYPDLADYPGIFYTLDGQGGAYEFAGFCLQSCQRKVAYAFETYPPGSTNGVLSATFGTFSSKKGSLKTSAKGLDPVNGSISYTAMQPMAVSNEQ